MFIQFFFASVLRNYFSAQQIIRLSFRILLDVTVGKIPVIYFLSQTSYSHSCLPSTLKQLFYHWEIIYFHSSMYFI
jgi:hypothetical protein